MKSIQVSVEVFAMIWTLRKDGEIDEDQILKRVLGDQTKAAASDAGPRSRQSEGFELKTSIERRRGAVALRGDEVMHQVGKIRWVDDIREALLILGGEASLFEIYKTVERIRREAGRSLTKTWEATVRRTLEDHSSDSQNYRAADLFYMPHGKGAGIWALRKKK